jgi:hypothetical protein
MLAAFFYITQAEPIRRQITPLYFLVKEKKKVPFFPDYPVLSSHYLDQEVIFGHFAKRVSNLNENNEIDFSKNREAIVDLHVMAVLNHFCKFYSREWNISKETLDLPGATMTTGGDEVETKRGKNDIVKYGEDKLAEIFGQNIFLEDTIPPSFGSLALPKNTKVFYSQPEGRYRELRFAKPLNFDIRIRIGFNLSLFGLGRVGHYMGLTDPEREYEDTRDPKFRNYETVALRMTCEASFPRYKNWNPKVQLYKSWTKRLFDDLYDRFDWSVCENKIKDHQAALANQKIIRGSK